MRRTEPLRELLREDPAALGASCRQLADLRRFTLRQLEITNRKVAHSGPAAVLG